MAGHLRDTATLMAPAVAEVIDALQLADSDKAAGRLARQYARVIDETPGHCRGCDDPQCRRGLTSAWLLRWIGPLLLDALAELGATPAARSRLKKGKPEEAKPGRLQALRDSRPA